MSSDTKFQLILCGVGLILGLLAEAIFGDYLKEKFGLHTDTEKVSEYTTSQTSQEISPISSVPSAQEHQSNDVYHLATALLDYASQDAQDTVIEPPDLFEEARQFLEEVDLPDWELSYDGKAVKNSHGYNLNHDSDSDYEWALGKDCDVFSYGENTQGVWLVGKHTWVVLFGYERVAFTKKSLPKNISKDFIKNCSVKSA